MLQKAQTFFKPLFRFLNSVIGLFTFLLLLIGIFIYSVAFFSPKELTSFLNDFYPLKKTSKTLSRLEEPIEGFGTALRVVKLKRNNKIYLDFLAKQEDQSFRWINSVELKGNREAFFDRWEKGLESPFSFPEAPGSIFITWSDHNQMEIIAPTFDSLFVPVLNRVLYNENTKNFELSPLFESYSQVKPRY